jgi:hypothetical protein
LAEQILSQRNAGPRMNRNMLVFCASAEARLQELRQGVRIHLAWKSIVADQDLLQLTPNDLKQANTKVSETDEIVNQRIVETFQHVLVPDQLPGTKDIIWHQTKPSGTGSIPERIAKKLESEERLITRYGGTRVRMDLDRIPLWSDRKDIGVEALWKAYCQFPYLPRLANANVLFHAISDGVSKLDWANETFAYADGHDGQRWVGLRHTEQADARPGGLVVHPEPATAQIAAVIPAPTPGGGATTGGSEGAGEGGVVPPPPPKPGKSDPTKYYARFDLSGARSIKQLEDVLRNIVDHLSAVDGSNVKLTLEVNATGTGFDERVVRVVKENAGQLGAKANEFEA